jgi:hypothetical protein
MMFRIMQCSKRTLKTRVNNKEKIMKFMLNKIFTHAAILAGLIVAADGHASLVSTLGGQAYYDTSSNLTWQADANLAASNTFGVGGIGTGGLMTWSVATNWINAMNAANYLGYNDWRLPTTSPVNGASFVTATTYNGTSDVGSSISAPGTAYAGSTASEMAYLFFNTLGSKAYVNFSGTVQVPVWQQNTSGPFSNLADGLAGGETYWSGTTAFSGVYAWNFDMDFGEQNLARQTYTYNAWAVRTGAPVPEPGAAWLMASGLLVVLAAKRRRAVYSQGTS